MIQELVQISRHFGKNLFFTQGAGGNFSVKESPDHLWIKGSGVWLADASGPQDFTRVRRCDFPYERWAGRSDDQRLVADREYGEWVHSLKTGSTMRRPSMELGFHLLIPQKWVLHVHAVGEMILGLMGEAQWPASYRAFLQESGVSTVQIEAGLPGVELSLSLYKAFEQRFASKSSTLVLLKNHGSIWCGEDIDALSNWMERSHQILAEFFEFDLYAMPPVTSGCVDFSAWPDFYYSPDLLYPDYAILFKSPEAWPTVEGRVVRLDSALSGRSLRWAAELVYVHALMSTILHHQTNLAIFPRDLAQLLTQMETEKHRQSLNMQGFKK